MSRLVKVVVLLLSITLGKCYISEENGIKIKRHSTLGPAAYLAINSEASTENGNITKLRRLEINWYNIDDDNIENYRIALYDKDPQIPSDSKVVADIEPILELDPKEHPGYYVTTIQLPYLTSESLGYVGRCAFDYWVQVVQVETAQVSIHPNNFNQYLHLQQLKRFIPITESRCLRVEPSWMFDNKEEFGKLRLNEILLAGTHDAAAFLQYEGEGDDNWITEAVFTQELDLEKQLQWGSRYLDIRVGYYPYTKEKFWLVHGPIETHPLEVGIKQVLNFLKNSNDILLWDTEHFEQDTWDDEAHQLYQDVLWDAFKDFWASPKVYDSSRSYNVTLNELWDGYEDSKESMGGKILFINGGGGCSDYEKCWPPIRHDYANSDDTVVLRNFLDSILKTTSKERPLKLYCQLTMQENDVIFKGLGLRDLADRSNRNVTQWWNTDYSYPDDLSTGVIATMHDYIVSTDMVHFAIERNKRVATLLKQYFF